MLVTAPYALAEGALLAGMRDMKFAFWAGAIYFLVSILINMVYPFLMPKMGFDGKRILLRNMLVKLLCIPFYIGVFFFGLIGNVMLIPLLPALFLIDYVLLLSTSMYGISGLARCRKNNEISAGTFTVNLILHFFFCADVVSAICAYAAAKKKSIKA